MCPVIDATDTRKPKTDFDQEEVEQVNLAVYLGGFLIEVGGDGVLFFEGGHRYGDCTKFIKI